MVKNISKHLRPGGFQSSTSLEAWMAGAAGAQHLSSKGSRLRDQWPSWIPAVMGLWSQNSSVTAQSAQSDDDQCLSWGIFVACFGYLYTEAQDTLQLYPLTTCFQCFSRFCGRDTPKMFTCWIDPVRIRDPVRCIYPIVSLFLRWISLSPSPLEQNLKQFGKDRQQFSVAMTILWHILHMFEKSFDGKTKNSSIFAGKGVEFIQIR